MSDWLFKEFLVFGNPESKVGIVTLWSDLENYKNIPKNLYHVMGNLHNQRAGGVAAIARNVLSHPNDIRVLILCGNDKNGSRKALYSWDVGDEILLKNPDAIQWLKENIEIYECHFEELVDILQKYNKIDYPYVEPREFPLPVMKESTWFPSEMSGHVVRGRSIDEAWRKILHFILRYGTMKTSKHGPYKEYLNILTVIDGYQSIVPFSKEEGEQYIKAWNDPELPEGLSYTYPNRLYRFFGQNGIDIMVEKLKKDKGARQAVFTLWDNHVDNGPKSAPCMSELQMHLTNGYLHFRATYRSHDIMQGYPFNLFALRDLQYKLCIENDWKLGTLTILSCSAHIYEYDLQKASEEAEKRTTCEWDRRGNVVVLIRNNQLVATIYSALGEFLTEYIGETPEKVLAQMIRDECLSHPSHWAWVALELDYIYQKIKKEIDCGIE